MKTTFNIKSLEDGWEWNDFFEVNDMLEEYCISVLDIPLEFLKDTAIKNKSISIELVKTKVYMQDDWYINLYRSSDLYTKCA